MEFYQNSIEQVTDYLKTNIEDGLTNKEAKKRFKKYGPNSIPQKKPISPFFIFIKQFFGPLMFILLVACIISLSINEKSNALVIALAIILNVIVGFFQEWKAEKSALALKSLEVPHCYIKRDGRIIFIESKNLVPGDLVLLSAGTQIPADLRLTHIIDLCTQEALLTGESTYIRKNTDTISKEVTVGDRTNIAFAGTYVLSGKGEGIVVQTGQNSYLGQVAKLITETKAPLTPLQKQITKFSWFLGALFLSTSIIVLLLGLYKGISFYNILLISIALAVAAIPEGLLVAITVVLAVGMQRMLKRKALVRNLMAAQTLGSVSIICTDKTGTLTQGVMKSVKIVSSNFDLELPLKDQSQILEEIKNILIWSILNNNAQLDHNSKNPIGTPTEIALLQSAVSAQIDIDDIRKKYYRLDEIPFSPDTKLMATLNQFDNEEILILKGAPEKVFAKCNSNDANLKKFKDSTEQLTMNGLRTIAIAIKKGTSFDLKKDIFDLECVGLVGIEDPLRPQAKTTIKELKKAGIRVVLVTGDHSLTAANIATKAGILRKQNKICTGEQLDQITDEQLEKQIDQIDVFARVEPRHKIRIVQAWQKLGKTVAMTGDGVNDAPALKTSDIGIALGSGSDITKEVAGIILLDNNLLTIDTAVKEGRTIFDNIRKVIVYLLSNSFSEMILIIAALILNLPIPITAAQILWINLISHGLPHLALTIEPREPENMKEAPRAKSEPLVNGEMRFIIFGIGIITDFILLTFYIWLLKTSSMEFKNIQAIMFTTFSINSLFFAFSMRSLRKSFLKLKFFSNIYLIYAFVGGLCLQLFITYTPIMQKLFSTIPLNFHEWVLVLLAALTKLIAFEIAKKLYPKRKIFKTNN